MGGLMSRLAYVIGNNNYEFWEPLGCAVNDASIIKAKLQKCGFDVRGGNNLKKTDLAYEIAQFKYALLNYDVGLLFFAGHGIECNGNQYLVPIDGSKPLPNKYADEDILSSYVSIFDLITEFSKADGFIGITILDCCRERLQYVIDRGISREADKFVFEKRGAFVAFATGSNSKAKEVAGNGFFTKAIECAFDDYGHLMIEEMFKIVRCEVIHKTNGSQVPWDYSSLTSNFYFKETEIGIINLIENNIDIKKRLYETANENLSYSFLMEKLKRLYDELCPNDANNTYLAQCFIKEAFKIIDNLYMQNANMMEDNHEC